MNINIKGKSIELTPAITEYVNKKIGAIEKHFGETSLATVQVEVGKTSEHHNKGDAFRAEVHITGPGVDVYAASEQSDLYAAIDLVKDEVVRNLSHEKGKKETRMRRGARKIKDMMRNFNFFRGDE